jgi:xylulokinase
MTNFYIGFDNGTMGTKVAIYSQDSELLSEYYSEHIINYPRPGWAEMEPDQFYELTVKGIKKCVSESRIDPKKVRGISCSGIISGFVSIDNDWVPTGPYIPYLDGRAKEEAHQILKDVEPLWIEESGNSEIGPHMPPIILKWIINNKKEQMIKTKKLVSASQYVLGKFGKLKAKEAFIDWAHLSGWMIGFDIIKRNWSYDQMKLLGIPIDLLPEVKKPWDIIGYLHKDEAEKIGLIEGVPLVAGAGDIMQSNVGSGVVEPNMSSDIAGTSSIFTVEQNTYNRKIAYSKTLYSSMSTIDNQYSYWGYIPAGGLSLRWLRDEIFMKKGDSEFYTNMDSIAEKIPAGSDYLLYFPFLQGRSAPSWPNASAAFLGLFGSNNVGHLWRSMLESVAFEYLTWKSIFNKIGIELKETVAIGGGSKSRLWNQIKADILNVRYITLHRSEGAVIGNAILAAFSVGDIKSIKQTAKEWIKIKEVYEPNKANNNIYSKIYEQREKILNEQLRNIFDQLNELHYVGVKKQ